MLDGEHAFGDIVIDSNGGYEHPWPRIYLADHANSEGGFYGEDDMFMVYKLRARWRLIEQDHKNLRKNVSQLLSMNDNNNDLLNEQLAKWNERLTDSNFPPFEKNDLRGMDLSGLIITPHKQSQVWLRHVDLSYTESHLLHIHNANMYGVRFVGAHAIQIDLRFAIAHGSDFHCCYMPHGRFAGANLGNCDFRFAILSHGVFDGANCQGTDFSSANLWKATFDSYIAPNSGKRVFTDLSEVIWDDDTLFKEVLFNDFLPEQNKKLADLISALKSPTTVKGQLASSVEMKPGLFGFSIDLAKISGCFKTVWKRLRKRNQRKSQHVSK